MDDRFTPMVEVLEPGKIGDYELKVRTITKEEVRLEQIKGMLNHSWGEVRDLEPGDYMMLKHQNTILMSDTPMERRTNEEFLQRATGDVLIGGLGIGMIVYPLLFRESVTSITVIEYAQEVIDLIGPQLEGYPNSGVLNIIQADALEWRPPRGTKYDTMYFDIWPMIGEDNWPDMVKLHRSYGQHKRTPDAYLSSWRKEDCRPKPYYSFLP